ncbi:transforming acidic coiled-coil-containing protein 1 [Plakobranchus ocellatus]|uniref:Transforming acidic coiled-coil-containing protein 1 n=1 Tax=Plakobranchus ocellatus TaxID=259542 RepID=A0AAV4CUX0_9GAST|nr:transforming acidic coiled-coil-containing protein 1 [Plakobranchus ocellatus]
MADGEDGIAPGSPPLPKKGSYNIDFDTLDDSVNPFESKIKLGSSPPIKSSSSYNFDADALDDIDPFKPKTAIPNSPVGSPKLTKNGLLTSDESPKAPVASDNDINHDDGGKLVETELSAKTSPKKKKVLKKVKVQSKIKAPKNVKPQEAPSDDIQIFMPGEPRKPTDENTSNSMREELQSSEQDSLVPTSDVTIFEDNLGKKARPSSLEEDVPYDPAPEAMVSSSEMDSHFLNTEDFDDLGFKKSSDMKELQQNTRNSKSGDAETSPSSVPEDLQHDKTKAGMRRSEIPVYFRAAPV